MELDGERPGIGRREGLRGANGFPAALQVDRVAGRTEKCLSQVGGLEVGLQEPWRAADDGLELRKLVLRDRGPRIDPLLDPQELGIVPVAYLQGWRAGAQRPVRIRSPQVGGDRVGEQAEILRLDRY